MVYTCIETSDLFGYFGSKETAGGILRQMLATKLNIDFEQTGVVELADIVEGRDAESAFYGRITDIEPSANGSASKLLCGSYSTKNCAYSNAYSADLVIFQHPGDKEIDWKDARYGGVNTYKNNAKGVLCAYKKASS